MRLFVDKNIEFQESYAENKIISIQWSRSKCIFAISFDDGNVFFYNEEGELLKDLAYKVR